SEIAEIAYDEVVEADREHRVPAARRALLVVVECAHTGDEDLPDFVLPRTAKDDRLPADRFETRMPRMVVRDGDDLRVRFRDGVPRVGVRGIGQHDHLAAAHPTARVAEQGEVD